MEHETPVEGNPASPEPAHGSAAPGTESSEAPAKPLYKGFTGELTTAEDLVKYTQTLETMLVANKQSRAAEPPAFTAPVVNTPAPVRESFADVIYSDPEKAKSILFEEWTQKENAKRDLEKREETFWNEFYGKNADLKDLRHVVQSVFKRDRAEIGDARRFPNNDSVAEYIAKESRDLVGLVKSKTGTTETRVDSQPAITFGGSSGEPGAVRPAQPSKPVDFASQLLRLKKRK